MSTADSGASANTNRRKVFVVEDDTKIAALLGDYLAAAEYDAHIFHDARTVIAKAKQIEPSAVILDVMLPAGSGLKLCSQLREFSSVPILMLTARIEEQDKIAALDCGADDYVTKPFGAKEVIARINALIRRAEGRLTTDISADGFAVDEQGLRIAWKGQWIDLSPSEFRILTCLVRQPGRVFSRDQLLDQLSASAAESTDRAVDSHIKNIRRKLQAIDPDAQLITSVYGAGYRLDA